MSRARILMVAVLLSGFAIGGCTGQKFTRQQYDTLYVGQPPGGVYESLGEPQERRGDVWMYVNDRPFYRAAIVFEDDRLAKKFWTTDRNKPLPPEPCPTR